MHDHVRAKMTEPALTTEFEGVHFYAKFRLSARKYSVSTPQEKEEETIGRTHARRLRNTRTVTRELTDLYADRLGVQLGVDGYLWRSEQVQTAKRRTWIREWTATKYPVSSTTLRRALLGEWGLALAEQQTTKHILLDVDVHDETPGEFDRYNIDHWLETSRSRARIRRRRAGIADHVRPIIEAVKAATPDANWIAVATPRGIHLVSLLDRAITVCEANRIGAAVIAAIGLPPHVEAFPRVETSGARTCRVPLSAGSRLLAPNLIDLRNRLRVDDVAKLIEAPTTSVEAFLSCVAEAKPVEQEVPEAAVTATPDPIEHRANEAPPPRKLVRARDMDGDLPGDARLRQRLHEHLNGKAFVDVLLEAHEHGMPDDSSFPTAQKLAFACVAAGLTRGDAEAVGKAWIGSELHRATHARNEQGRRAWLRTYRAELRHQERGVVAGRVRVGHLTDPRLWGMLESLLGRRPGRRQTAAKVSEARSRAAKMRWAKRVA